MQKEKNIVKLLNKLYSIELESYSLYMVFASNLDVIGLKNISSFLKDLAEDKIGPHNKRVFNYLNAFNEIIQIENNLIKKDLYKIDLKKNPKEIAINILEKTLTNELNTRKFIFEIADKSLSSKDFETFEFIQWFIKDYIKDIHEIDDLLFKLKDKDSSIFDIDTK